jgi:hypothetical protein
MLEINLHWSTRAEIEEGRTDIVRFDHPNDYETETDLKWFRDEQLRQLFVKVFWQQPANIVEVLDDAVKNYPSSKSRVLQIRDLILKQYARDGA